MNSFEIICDEYGTWYIKADPEEMFPGLDYNIASSKKNMSISRIARGSKAPERVKRLIKNLDCPELTEKTLNTFIEFAIRLEAHESFIALLELKRKCFGFKEISKIANSLMLE